MSKRHEYAETEWGFPEVWNTFECGDFYDAEYIQDWITRFIVSFPTCKEWNQFVEDMKDADVWYNVLDSPQEGKILDYLYEIMAWKEKWLSQFNKNYEEEK